MAGQAMFEEGKWFNWLYIHSLESDHVRLRAQALDERYWYSSRELNFR